MWRELRNYFLFSKKDIRGIYVLLFILIVTLFVRVLIPMFTSSPEPDFSDFEQMVLALEKSRYEAQKANEKHESQFLEFNRPDKEIAAIKLNPFIFDPNNMTEEQWFRLGLNAKQVRNLQNFIAHGGKFRKKEDFKRIYTISENEYEILEPYIQIAVQEQNKEKDDAMNRVTYEKPVSEKPKSVKQISINLADSVQLLAVPGIGPAFARRIMKYRELLGGFHSPAQLLEVYGLDPERYNQVVEYFIFDASLLRFIEVNTAEVKELTAHPYIDFYLAKSIVDQRIKKGNLMSDIDLYDIPMMHDSLFQKVIPYFKFN